MVAGIYSEHPRAAREDLRFQIHYHMKILMVHILTMFKGPQNLKVLGHSTSPSLSHHAILLSEVY